MKSTCFQVKTNVAFSVFSSRSVEHANGKVAAVAVFVYEKENKAESTLGAS